MWKRKQAEDNLPLKVKEYVRRVQEVMIVQCPDKSRLEYAGKRQAWRSLSSFQQGKSVRMTFEVPTGLSFLDIDKHRDAISARCGCPVELKNNLGSVEIAAFPFDMPTFIPFHAITHHIDPTRGYLLGFDRAGEPVYIQFYEPHILIAGATGFGKTAFLLLFFLQLLTEHAPWEVQIQLIDLKGTDFIFLEEYPHMMPIVSTLAGAVGALARAYNLMRERQQMIIESKRKGLGAPEFPILYVVIDEAASIAPSQQPNKELAGLAQEGDAYLSDLARIGRSAGIRILYCTQYPTAEIVNSQVKSQVTQRLSFRQSEKIKSMVVLDEIGAEELEVKGRAIYKTSAGKQWVQVPWASEEEYSLYIGLAHTFTFWRDRDEERNEGESDGAATGHADHFDPASVPLLPNDSPLHKAGE